MRSSFRTRFHLSLVLSILIGCLAARGAPAISLAAGAGIEAPISLSGHVAILRDPSGALAIGDVTAPRFRGQFAPLPSMLTEGYRKGAIWVRFTLSAPVGARRWLLQIERPLIEHVALYGPDGRGGYSMLPPSSLQPGGQAGAYAAVFPISVLSKPVDYYLRLQSSSSITTSLNIWQEEGYKDHRRNDDWLMGLILGAISVMIFTNIFHSIWLRDGIYVFYIGVLFESGLMSIFHMGYASEIFSHLEPYYIHRLWGVVICIYTIVMMLFLARLFEFHRQSIPAWRSSQVVSCINGIFLIFSIFGHFGDVGYILSILQQISLISVAIFVLYLLIIRKQYQYMLPAVAFLGAVSALLMMQLLFTGFNPFKLNNSLSRVLACSTLIHLVLLSAAVARRAQYAERSLSEERGRLLDMALSAENDLAVKVDERTAELAGANASLKMEVDRRHQLEVKLRQSLDSVNDALAQQRDFLALVSHEFRSPLSAIVAAAENLSRTATSDSVVDVKARGARIRQIARRLSMLIENVLTGDQLDSQNEPSTRILLFDLNDVLHAAHIGLDDDADGRVRFIYGNEALIRADPQLVEIVIQNLIQNALKHSPEDQSITVRISADSGAAHVEVVDRGKGVAVRDRELIFVKYYRASGQRVGGTGLGLYIGREIARQFGGDLILAASDERGSTFRLTLPLGELLPGEG